MWLQREDVQQLTARTVLSDRLVMATLNCSMIARTLEVSNVLEKLERVYSVFREREKVCVRDVVANLGCVGLPRSLSILNCFRVREAVYIFIAGRHAM
jgi:hypothetical protein